MGTELEEQYDKIYKYCYFHVHDRVLAEDLTQETFLRYLGRKAKTDGEKQLAYLYTIARNLCTDYYRKRDREMLGFEETDVEETLEEKAFSDDMPVSRLPEQLALRQAVLALPEDMRELVWLRFVQEEPVAVAAEILGISRFAVYRREKQVLALLRKHLEG